MPRPFITYMVLLATLIPITVAAYLIDGIETAALIGQGGGALAGLGAFIYIAGWDSRTRWPNTTIWQRALNILTFTR